MIVVMMVVMMGCNNGVSPREEFLNSMVNLGKGFLDVFVVFGDMINGTLGIKAETKKSEIGAYFTKIENTMKTVKLKLGKILEEYGNYEKVKEKVEEFIGKIGKIEEGAKEAAKGATTDTMIGNAVKDRAAVAADKDVVNVLVKGIKGIVGVVLKADEGDAVATKTDGEQQKSIGGLFSGNKDDGTDAVAAAASASIGAVSGVDILQAIVKSEEVTDVELKIDQVKNAAEIAAAKQDNAKKEITVGSAKKDAVIAAGIALRAMAKGGKFAAKNEDKSVQSVNGVVSSAVNKVLSTLIIAIRNTVDSGLKEINNVLKGIEQGDSSLIQGN
ncbi:variable large family protein [Borrelia persica]|uniref:variable large family protein n=1 Tax=Borrelia persica TaxID=44448 RepID=UPI0004662337|nr:variable large family protein [Borrelia persica]